MSKQDKINDLQKKLDSETNHRNRLQLQVDLLVRQRRILIACVSVIGEEADLLNGFAAGNYEGPGRHHFRYQPEEEGK